MLPESSTFDDARPPAWVRMLNQLGVGLRQSGLPWVDLRESALLQAAQRQTGLSDWGDDRFREPLRILLDSLERESNLTLLGRFLQRQYCLRLLTNRLLLQRDFQQFPAIAEVPIRRPLFVLGLPRTGSTLLHNLLAQDPANRWLRLWELTFPSPPPAPDEPTIPARIAETTRLIRWYTSFAPQFAIAHVLNPLGPEECNSLFEHDFASLLFEVRSHIPSYAAWLEQQAMVPQYRYYRRQLQLLSWRWPGARWLLKAPAHLLDLEALLSVFPDACIVQTHREPLTVVPSMCSLGAIAHSAFSERVDCTAIGQHWLDRWTRGMEQALTVRQSAPAEQFCDVQYAGLVRDPVGTVRHIYAAFDLPFPPDLPDKIQHWLAENPRHKHGPHRYSLEQFGLDETQVKQAFSNYYQQHGSRFGVAGR